MEAAYNIDAASEEATASDRIIYGRFNESLICKHELLELIKDI